LLNMATHSNPNDGTAPLLLCEGEHPDTLEGFSFSTLEWDQLCLLNNALQFAHLRELQLSPLFAQKIHALFRSRISS
jgi:hypothetical protein